MSRKYPKGYAVEIIIALEVAATAAGDKESAMRTAVEEVRAHQEGRAHPVDRIAPQDAHMNNPDTGAHCVDLRVVMHVPAYDADSAEKFAKEQMQEPYPILPVTIHSVDARKAEPEALDRYCVDFTVSMSVSARSEEEAQMRAYSFTQIDEQADGEFAFPDPVEAYVDIPIDEQLADDKASEAAPA